MSQELDNLKAAVAASQGAEASAITLLQGLHQKLTDLINAGANPADLQALADTLNADTQALSAAVAQNPLP